jgi:hypothetical protein
MGIDSKLVVIKIKAIDELNKVIHNLKQLSDKIVCFGWLGFCIHQH